MMGESQLFSSMAKKEQIEIRKMGKAFLKKGEPWAES